LQLAQQVNWPYLIFTLPAISLSCGWADEMIVCVLRCVVTSYFSSGLTLGGAGELLLLFFGMVEDAVFGRCVRLVGISSRTVPGRPSLGKKLDLFTKFWSFFLFHFILPSIILTLNVVDDGLAVLNVEPLVETEGLDGRREALVDGRLVNCVTNG
jgi:hypothetical protein